MDVRAVLLLGEPGGDEPDTAESIAGMPIALLPVLGRPVVHRVAENLSRAGIEEIRVIANACSASLSMERYAQCSGLDWVRTPGERLWKAAEETIVEFCQQGADLVLLIRVGAYLEFNVDDLIQFHLDRNARVTRLAGRDRAYDYFVISASRRNDAAFLLRNRLQQMRMPSPDFKELSYENPLAAAHDLRKLAQDSLSLKTGIVPQGRELRPGIWVGRGAKIERGARVVAPAYIGEGAIVRVASLVTRCSSVEHHAEIDCGTVIEDSSVLPFSYVGAGLEVSHSTVAFRQLTNHRRGITIEIVDPVLLDMVPWRGLSRFKNRISAMYKLLAKNWASRPAGGEQLAGAPQWASAGNALPPRVVRDSVRENQALGAELPEADLMRIYEGE